MDDAGGWLWLVIDVGFVAILAAALIYGVTMWHFRRRNRAAQQARDEATRELYRQGE
jgi:Ni/Fe-hydrogenase subunit HybB-like protein